MNEPNPTDSHAQVTATSTMAPAPLLDVDDLRTYFDTDEGTVKAVDGVSFSVRRGQTLGIVGESGCGKSITAFSILRLIPSPPGRIVAGSIRFSKEENDSSPIDLAQLHPRGREIRQIRGNEIAMIFQEPMTSLSPVHTIGNQISEAVRLHQQTNRAEAKTRSIEALRRVRLPRLDRQYDAFPHELSGGMRQRVMIAMALVCNPSLLIADEPTTALDVTVQSQILDLLEELQEEMGMSIILITHDLGVIARMADDVAVMYLGKVVEHADVETLFSHPLHPYTRGLLKSVPQIGRRQRLVAIEGTVPDPLHAPPGCSFAPRCPHADSRCQTEPELTEVEAGQQVSCWLHTAFPTAVRQP